MLLAVRSLEYFWYQLIDSLRLAVTHVEPTCSQKSLTGVTVKVKSSFGFFSGGSLNTLWSMPMLVTAIVGFIINGPMWTRTFLTSGMPSISWAHAGAPGRSATATRHTATKAFFKKGFPVPLFGAEATS